MNPVLILCRNNLPLTKNAVASLQSQDIPTDILLIDNDSTDGTMEWANNQNINAVCFRPQLGVSVGWNWGIRYFFRRGESHVLVCNNDIELPTWGYRTLLNFLSQGFGVVTGASTTNRNYLEEPEEVAHPPVPHPDFSCFLISRMAWEKIGEFDERMKLYAQDCDYSVRTRRSGIPLLRAEMPFYHERSSTLNNATPQERRAIQLQADADREVFKSKYGCMPWEPAYDDLLRGASSLLQK